MRNLISILFSLYFTIRGFMYLSEGKNWGWVMLIVGLGGLAFKIYEYAKGLKDLE